MSSIGNSIINQIGEVMKENNVKKIELANKLGVKKQAITDLFGRIKSNKGKVETIVKYSAALGYDLIIVIQDTEYNMSELSVGIALKMQIAKHDLKVSDAKLPNTTNYMDKLKRNTANLDTLIDICNNLGFSIS